MAVSKIEKMITYVDDEYYTAAFSGVNLGGLISTINKTVYIGISGYIPIAVALRDYPSTMYNVSVQLLGDSVYFRHYAAVSNASQSGTVKYRIVYMRA